MNPPPKKSGLGRGLASLIPEKPKPAPVAPPAPLPPVAAPVTAPVASAPAAPAVDAGVLKVSVSMIEPNPYQPRQTFQADALAELVASVREKGIMQPILVRRMGAIFQLIAGERRFRAAMEAGFKEVPVLVKEMTDQESLEFALVENLQRQDLNPMEEAEGYRHLMDKFHLTQELVAQKVGKARASVANALRLLNLAPEARRLLREGTINAGHAKALLGLEIAEEQELIAGRIAKEGLSVREVEKLIAQTRKSPKKPRAERSDIPETHLRHITELIQQRLGTSIRLTPTRLLANGKRLPGKLEVDFFSGDDLDRLIGILGLTDQI